MRTQKIERGDFLATLPTTELNAIIEKGGAGFERLLDEVLAAVETEPDFEEPERWDGCC